MGWNLDKDKPICPQITERLSMMIARGQFEADQRLMSVREVAVEAGVNPNTVQKAFEQLEAKGIIYSVRGSGWFVSPDMSRAKEEAERIVTDKIASFFTEMEALGYSAQQTKEAVGRWQ